MNKIKLFSLPALLMLSVTAYAGFTQPAPVIIDMDNMFAQGDMLTARNSKNDDEYIGCGMRKFDDGAGGATSWGFCQAQIDEETQVTCFTFNADVIEGANLIAESSFITFSWDDDGTGNLTCNRIGSSSQSFYLPKGNANKP